MPCSPCAVFVCSPSPACLQGAGLLALWASTDGIMIDDTPPVCVEYRVRDGAHRLLDAEFQGNTETVVAQWRSALFDLEVRREAAAGLHRSRVACADPLRVAWPSQSLVARFEVRLEDMDTGEVIAGPLAAGKATTIKFNELQLHHKQRVQSVVTAVNRAGAEYECSTNGMLIDTTGPEPLPSEAGVIWDGNNALFGYEGDDLEYTWSTRSAFAAWAAFVDPESRVNNYWLWTESMDGAIMSSRRWVHPSLVEWTMPIPTRAHGDLYRVVLRAVNGAGSYRDYRSDGIQVDVTAPVFKSDVEFRIDGPIGLEPHIVASEGAKLSIIVHAHDPESGILRCRYALGTYPDGSDLTGVITAETKDLAPADRTYETRSRGGDRVCFFDGTCADIEESKHNVTTDVRLDRVLNEDVDLLNHFTFYAWVVCINKYVPAACVLGCACACAVSLTCAGVAAPTSSSVSVPRAPSLWMPARRRLVSCSMESRAGWKSTSAPPTRRLRVTGGGGATTRPGSGSTRLPWVPRAGPLTPTIG